MPTIASLAWDHSDHSGVATPVLRIPSNPTSVGWMPVALGWNSIDHRVDPVRKSRWGAQTRLPATSIQAVSRAIRV